MRHELALLFSVSGCVCCDSRKSRATCFYLKGFLYVIRLTRQNLTAEALFFQNRQQRYNNFSRYANNVLIFMRVRVFDLWCGTYRINRNIFAYVKKIS